MVLRKLTDPNTEKYDICLGYMHDFLETCKFDSIIIQAVWYLFPIKVDKNWRDKMFLLNLTKIIKKLQ